MRAYVVDFDYGQYIGHTDEIWKTGGNGDYQTWNDDKGGLHERFSFKMMNGTIRRTTYCFVSADRKKFSCTVRDY